MRVTYFVKGDEIVDGTLIFKNYIFSFNFIIDVLSSIPTTESHLAFMKNFKLLKVLRLLRIHRFK